MGQQQLLLLVLSIVIVGLAVVAGIEAFGENQRKATQDRLTQQVITYGTEMIAWKLKPAAQGGGQNAVSFTGLTLADLGIPSNTTPYTANGVTYGLWVLTGATPHFSIQEGDLSTAAFVYGPKPECIVHRLTTWENGVRTDIPSLHPPNPDPAVCSF